MARCCCVEFAPDVIAARGFGECHVPIQDNGSSNWLTENVSFCYLSSYNLLKATLLSQSTMKSFRTIALILVLAISAVNAFSPVSSTTGSSFVVSQRPRAVEQPSACPARSGASSLQMGNMAKFGIFSPAVYGAKIALGTDKLNKIRGKAISLHSKYIGEFCEWAGAYHLRTRLIKKAKTNGDILGFLV